MRLIVVALVLTAILAAPAVAAEPPPEAASGTAPETTAELAAENAAKEKSLEDRVSDLETAMDELLTDSGIEFYGHIKLDMAYDTSRTNDGNTAMWVLPYVNGNQDNEFNMTARHTRFGLNYVAPDSWGPAATGQIEIDFYGGGAENKANVRLRQAWLKMDFRNGLSLLAGQTWDVIMPLWQWKLNTAVGWNQGNVAFRRAQLRVEYEGKAGEKTGYKFGFAIADPIGVDADKDNYDDAEDSGKADLQGRAGLTFPLFLEAAPCTIGVNGLYGWREADFVGQARKDRYNAWLFGFDLTIPITKDVKILSELFTGQSLSLYAAGIGQSYNTKKMDTISTTAGFVNVHWKVDKLWFVVVGTGVDDPNNSDLNIGNRSRNSTIFGNVRYKITKAVWVGLELDYMVTQYLRASSARDFRTQVTFMLKF